LEVAAPLSASTGSGCQRPDLSKIPETQEMVILEIPESKMYQRVPAAILSDSGANGCQHPVLSLKMPKLTQIAPNLTLGTLLLTFHPAHPAVLSDKVANGFLRHAQFPAQLDLQATKARPARLGHRGHAAR